MDHRVPIAGKAVESTYMGNAVGRWEGGTLVLDSISFVDSTWLGRVGFFHSARTLRLNPDPDAGLLPERAYSEVYELEDIASQIRH
jgi:hypothetical protein